MKAYAMDPAQRRAVFSESVASASELLLGTFERSPHFACLVVWDSRSAELVEVDALLSMLLRRGASYLMFWGPGCSVLHGIADETIVELDAELELPEGATVMTTDHASESLDDALLFFSQVSSPAPPLDETTRAGIVLVVGSEAWAAQVDEGLGDPEALIERVVLEER